MTRFFLKSHEHRYDRPVVVGMVHTTLKCRCGKYRQSRKPWVIKKLSWGCFKPIHFSRAKVIFILLFTSSVWARQAWEDLPVPGYYLRDRVQQLLEKKRSEQNVLAPTVRESITYLVTWQNWKGFQMQAGPYQTLKEAVRVANELEKLPGHFAVMISPINGPME